MLDPFSDPAGPALHVLPQLLQPGDVRGSMPARRVGCAVTIAGLETPALVIRRPYPNRRYYVAGSARCRHGFLVPLPAPVPAELTVLVTWTLPFADPQAILGHAQDPVTIRHEITLLLEPCADGQVFSMDTSAHRTRPTDALAPVKTTPWATWSVAALPPNRQHAWLPQDGALQMKESLVLPGGMLSDIWAFAEIDGRHARAAERRRDARRKACRCHVPSPGAPA